MTKGAAQQIIDDYVTHHNARRAEDGGGPVTAVWDGDTLTLTGPAGVERFTAQGLTLTGRGGSFNLEDRVQHALAIATVLPQTPSNIGMGVGKGLTERGFEITEGEWRRWKYDCHVVPYTARRTEKGGSETVIWLHHIVSDNMGDASVNASGFWLATHCRPWDQESMIMLESTDAELAEDDLLEYAPDSLVDYGVRATPEALDALVARALAGDWETPLPGGPPEDFYKNGRYEAFPLEHTRITRAMAQARRAERDA